MLVISTRPVPLLAQLAVQHDQKWCEPNFKATQGLTDCYYRAGALLMSMCPKGAKISFIELP